MLNTGSVTQRTVYFASWGALLMWVVNMVISGLSNAHILGKSNGEVSRKYPTPLTPAGYAFGIWGIIFMLQALWALYGGAFPPKVKYPNTITEDSRIEVLMRGGPFICLCWLFETLWQVSFSREAMWPAMFLIAAAWIAMTCATIVIHSIREESGLHIVDTVGLVSSSMNAGWLTVAVCAAVLITAEYHTGCAPEKLVSWGVGLAAAGTLLTLVMLLWKNDVVFALAVVWGLRAIQTAQGQKYPIIGTATMVCYCILLVGCALALGRVAYSHWRAGASVAGFVRLDGDDGDNVPIKKATDPEL